MQSETGSITSWLPQSAKRSIQFFNRTCQVSHGESHHQKVRCFRFQVQRLRPHGRSCEMLGVLTKMFQNVSISRPASIQSPSPNTSITTSVQFRIQNWKGHTCPISKFACFVQSRSWNCLRFEVFFLCFHGCSVGILDVFRGSGSFRTCQVPGISIDKELMSTTTRAEIILGHFEKIRNTKTLSSCSLNDTECDFPVRKKCVWHVCWAAPTTTYWYCSFLIVTKSHWCCWEPPQIETLQGTNSHLDTLRLWQMGPSQRRLLTT